MIELIDQRPGLVEYAGYTFAFCGERKQIIAETFGGIVFDWCTFLFAACHFIIVQNGGHDVHFDGVLNLLYDLLMEDDDRGENHLPILGEIEILQLLFILCWRIQFRIFLLQAAVLLQKVQEPERKWESLAMHFGLKRFTIENWHTSSYWPATSHDTRRYFSHAVLGIDFSHRWWNLSAAYALVRHRSQCPYTFGDLSARWK